ncbi:hypothetical protein GF377_06535 [candidate division GN15 bacterium]|nr:hypothetical protein [candidate division GN15 bacterium]
MALELTFGLVEYQFGGGKSRVSEHRSPQQFDFDSVSWSFANGWHVFYFETSFIEIEIEGAEVLYDTIDISGMDSLRFFEDGQVVLEPTDTTDSLWSRQHVDVRVASSEGELFAVRAHHDLRIAAVGSDANGEWIRANMDAVDSVDAIVLDGEGGSCDLSVATLASFVNILFAIELIDDVCPSSGSLNATQQIDLSCQSGTELDSLNLSGTWTAQQSFVDGVATTTVLFGGMSWTGVDTCGIPAIQTR